MDGHHLECSSDIDFCEPRILNQGYSLVDVVIMQGKFFERDEAVYAWDQRIVRGWEIDYQSFFSKNDSKGGVLNRPIMKPDSISFLISLSIVSGSARADWRLLQMMLCEAFHTRFETVLETSQ